MQHPVLTGQHQTPCGSHYFLVPDSLTPNLFKIQDLEIWGIYTEQPASKDNHYTLPPGKPSIPSPAAPSLHSGELVSTKYFIRDKSSCRKPIYYDNTEKRMFLH